jgi:hypothetical protein
VVVQAVPRDGVRQQRREDGRHPRPGRQRREQVPLRLAVDVEAIKSHRPVYFL